MPSSRHFVRHLAIVCTALLVCASIYPASGWRETGLPIFDYLTAPWPKYFDIWDFILNIIGYMPLGLTVVPSLPRSWPREKKLAITVFLAVLLSFTVETIQNFLPTRVASNLDLAANGMGALLGALLGVRWGEAIFAPGRGLARWRERHFARGRAGDAALILLMLWILVQMTPDQMLFAGGGWRRLLDIAPPLSFDPNRLIVFETAQTASMILAVGLFARCTLRTRGGTLVLWLLLLGVAARFAACNLFFLVPSSPLNLVTPGAKFGLLAGTGLLLIALRLPRVAQHALAGASLLMTSLLINMMPESPYFTTGVIRRVNYQNFYGVCRLLGALWPFAALAYLSALGLWRGEHLEEDRDTSDHGRPTRTTVEQSKP